MCPLSLTKGHTASMGLHTINLTTDHLPPDKVLDRELTPRWRQSISFKVVCN